jgi:hypothetical protein
MALRAGVSVEEWTQPSFRGKDLFELDASPIELIALFSGKPVERIAQGWRLATGGDEQQAYEDSHTE